MRKFLFGLSMLGSWLAVTMPASAAPNLVANPGFETGNFSSWSHTGNTSFDSIQPFPGSQSQYVHSGGFGAELGASLINPPASPGRGFLDQTLATAIGSQYQLTFWLYSTNTGTPGSNFPNDFQSSLGGSVVLDLSNVNTTSNSNPQPALGTGFQLFSAPLYTATSASTVLDFSYFNNPAFFGLDDISVTLFTPPPPGTPEPSSLALTGIGAVVGGLVMARRRRRAASAA